MQTLLVIIFCLIASPKKVDAHSLLQDKVQNLLKQPLPEDLQLKKEYRGQQFCAIYDVDRADHQIPLGKIHSWNLTITPLHGQVKAQNITFFAEMPQHLHSMPTEPRIAQNNPYSFRIEGLKFHMPGWWRTHICIHSQDHSKGAECLKFDFIL